VVADGWGDWLTPDVMEGAANALGQAWLGTQQDKAHTQSGTHTPTTNDPNLRPATAGTVGIDTEGTSPVVQVPATGTGTSTGTKAPTSSAGTVNIDTTDDEPVDCNGLWLVPPPGC
jgi:hypothetical protein